MSWIVNGKNISYEAIERIPLYTKKAKFIKYKYIFHFTTTYDEYEQFPKELSIEEPFSNNKLLKCYKSPYYNGTFKYIEI